MTRDEEVQAIDDAVKAGRLRRLKPGESSDWDEMPYGERKAIMSNNAKRSHGKKKIYPVWRY